MPNDRRAWNPSGTYFFTVNLLERSGNDLLLRHIDLLPESVKVVRAAHLFAIHASNVVADKGRFWTYFYFLSLFLVNMKV